MITHRFETVGEAIWWYLAYKIHRIPATREGCIVYTYPIPKS